MKVEIRENEYGKCDANSQLVYPGVDSCLTVTALFGDGSRTGAHLTEVDADGGYGWKNVFGQWKKKTLEKQDKTKHGGLSTVFVLGDLYWSPEAMAEIENGIAELGDRFKVTATDTGLKVETWYGDISVDHNGKIGGSRQRKTGTDGAAP